MENTLSADQEIDRSISNRPGTSQYSTIMLEVSTLDPNNRYNCFAHSILTPFIYLSCKFSQKFTFQSHSSQIDDSINGYEVANHFINIPDDGLLMDNQSVFSEQSALKMIAIYWLKYLHQLSQNPKLKDTKVVTLRRCISENTLLLVTHEADEKFVTNVRRSKSSSVLFGGQ